jgi:hypothetical protein
VGLKADWKEIRAWLRNTNVPFPATRESSIDIPLKFPSIPVLDDYAANPPSDFWQFFPTNNASIKLATNVHLANLEHFVKICWPDWTPFEQKTAMQAIKNIQFGTQTTFSYDFLPVNKKNARSAIKNGKHMTDIIAT